MKKAVCVLAAISLILSLGACAAGKREPAPAPESIVSGGGAIVFSSSREDPEPGPSQGENPPAVSDGEGPSYAPIPSSSLPSYSSSSISYPNSSSKSQGSSSGSSQTPPPSSASPPPPDVRRTKIYS